MVSTPPFQGLLVYLRICHRGIPAAQPAPSLLTCHSSIAPTFLGLPHRRRSRLNSFFYSTSTTINSTSASPNHTTTSINHTSYSLDHIQPPSSITHQRMLNKWPLQPCPPKLNHLRHQSEAPLVPTKTSLVNLPLWHSALDLRDADMLGLLPSATLYLVFCLLVARRKAIPCARSTMVMILEMLSDSYKPTQRPCFARACRNLSKLPSKPRGEAGLEERDSLT